MTTLRELQDIYFKHLDEAKTPEDMSVALYAYQAAEREYTRKHPDHKLHTPKHHKEQIRNVEHAFRYI